MDDTSLGLVFSSLLRLRFVVCFFLSLPHVLLSHAWNWVGPHAGRDSCPSWAGSRLPKSQKSGLRGNKIAAARFPLSFRPFRFKNCVFRRISDPKVCVICLLVPAFFLSCIFFSVSWVSSPFSCIIFLFCLASLSSACHGIRKFWVWAKCARDLSRLHLWGDHSAETSSENYFFLILFFLFFCLELFVQWLEWTECRFSAEIRVWAFLGFWAFFCWGALLLLAVLLLYWGQLCFLPAVSKSHCTPWEGTGILLPWCYNFLFSVLGQYIPGCWRSSVKLLKLLLRMI